MNVNIRSDKAISSEMHLNIIINDRIFAEVLSCALLCTFYMPKYAYTPKLMRVYTLFMCCENAWIFNIVIKTLKVTHSNFSLLDNEKIYSSFLQ